MVSDCPLCLGESVRQFAVIQNRTYWRCQACLLTFLSPEQRPDPDRERAEYELHRNRPDDAGYRAFLSRLTDCLASKLPPGATGLDYGCGPGPTLSLILAEQGFSMAVYDPYSCAG